MFFILLFVSFLSLSHMCAPFIPEVQEVMNAQDSVKIAILEKGTQNERALRQEFERCSILDVPTNQHKYKECLNMVKSQAAELQHHNSTAINTLPVIGHLICGCDNIMLSNLISRIDETLSKIQ